MGACFCRIIEEEGPEMWEGMNKAYFGRAFAEKVRDALERNRDKPGNIYYHPTEGGVIEKCISLSCQKPLHDAKEAHPKDSSSEERWLEAYLIQQAKKNDWMLEMAGKKWKFLSSQFKFREAGEKAARPLDLLLYEPDTYKLVVLELKVERELAKAKQELGDYCGRLNGGLKDEIAQVFGLERVSGVQGYIVWPKNEAADNAKHDFGMFGVIEYPKLSNPWDEYKKLGENLVIEFTCVKPPDLVENPG